MLVSVITTNENNLVVDFKDKYLHLWYLSLLSSTITGSI